MKLDQIAELIDKARSEAQKAATSGELHQIKAKYLGKKSPLSTKLRAVAELPTDQRAAQGKVLNKVRLDLEEIFATQLDEIISEKRYQPIDLTATDTTYSYGHLHPTSRILDKVYQIFSHLGFAIVDGPEIETDWYNFEVLGIPPDHPARDTQDTFYLTEQSDGRPLIPRTQTSAMQVRFLENNKPPVKIVVPGKVFRNENEDRTHAWIFNQIEGLVVGEGVSLANLKGTLEFFIREVLGQDSTIRMRPSFFPYTEPSVEVDAWYKGEWLEMGGAGMVHPDVLKNSGIDST